MFCIYLSHMMMLTKTRTPICESHNRQLTYLQNININNINTNNINMQIRAGLSQFMNNLTAPPTQPQIITTKDKLYELDNRSSRHMRHAKQAKDGWKPSQHDVQKLNRYKGQMQNRGDSHKLGDARAARAEM